MGLSRDEEIKGKTIGILGKHPEGLTIQDLSQLIKANRQTITKYVLELKGAGVVHRRRVGSATLHYLNRTSRDLRVIR